MKITLKDGSVKEYASPMSIIDIAKDISEGLARVACLGEVDGEEEDLRTVIDHDCQLNILTAKDEKGLAALRHTASHLNQVHHITPIAGYPSDCRGSAEDRGRDEENHQRSTSTGALYSAEK